MNARRIMPTLILTGMLVAVFCSGAVLGQAPAPATGEEAAPQVSDEAVAAPQQSPADDDAQEAAEKTEAFRDVLRQARSYLVTVATRWQKDQGELPESGYGMSFERSVMELVENKQSSEEEGVMVDPASGLVLAVDHGKESRFIESVKGHTADGREFPLQRHGFYVDVDAAGYRTDRWPGPKEPLAWFEGPLDLFGGGPVVTASLDREGLGWEVAVSFGSGGRLTQVTDANNLDSLTTVAGTGLVFDEEARPLGFTTGTRISLTGERYPWRGDGLAGRQLLTFAEFDKLRGTVEEEVGRYAHEVRIVYRQPEGEEENLTFEGEDQTSLTQFYYGYAISPNRVFVPVKLEKIYIQRFKEITIRIGDRDVPARFLGAYLDFGGFVVEMDGATSPGVLPMADAGPVPDFHRAVLTYVHERKFGRRRDTVWYNRVRGYGRGYKDRLWPELKTPPARGALILGIDRRPIGLCLIERRLEEEKKGEGGRWRYYYRGQQDGLQLYCMDQLVDAFKDPQAHFDPNLKPASEQEEKRLVWLGVETQPVGPRLAEMLDRLAGSKEIQKWTRKGEIGLRVAYVYEGSPAEKAGIVEGDILLEITEEGKTVPIELEPGSRSGYRSYGRYGSGASRGGFSSSPAGGRRNYLTELLTRLGPGTKIALTYLHGTEKKTHDFALEWAPHDLESADKFKDEKTGLTVKNLTYDIRAALRLKNDQPGVVVAKVEEGEKADIAQIGTHQIITEINGRPVRSVDEYKEIITPIAEGQQGGTAVLALLWMGKSHMVKITY